MSGGTRWNVVPRSAVASVLSLVAGLLILGSTVWQMADAGRVAVIPLIAAVLAVALVVVAVVGLVRKNARGR